MANTIVGQIAESTEVWVDQLHDWLQTRYFSGDLGEMAAVVIVALGTIAIATAVHLIVRLIIVACIRKVVIRTRTRWDDFLVQHRFFTAFAHLASAAVVYLAAPLFTPPFFRFDAEIAVERIALGYMVLTGIMLVDALLNAAGDIYGTLEMARKNPIKGFVQGLKLVVWIVGGILFVATLTGRDPSGLVAGIGAVTAVIMLVFKDSILGMVASIQIFVNDLVHVGDWIEMPKYNVDGEVIDITLTTLKVRNWDKTVTTVPAYSVIADSFKNWRGMQESGARRIKRSIRIDMSTCRFCTEEMLDKFERFDILKDYISEKRRELQEFNKRVDQGEAVNGRRLTNIGTFRAYLRSYLSRHEKIDLTKTFLVRQLPPTENGLPIEIYVFSNDTRWVNYEDIQADIFDHILAVLPEFGLEIFQNPSGRDWQHALSAGPRTETTV